MTQEHLHLDKLLVQSKLYQGNIVMRQLYVSEHFADK